MLKPRGNVPYIQLVTAKLQDLARLQTVNHSLSFLFSQGDTDVCAQTAQADALILT